MVGCIVVTADAVAVIMVGLRSSFGIDSINNFRVG